MAVGFVINVDVVAFEEGHGLLSLRLLQALRDNTKSALLLDKSLIFVVRTDPDPDEIRVILDGQRSVMRTSPDRPELANFFEV